MAVFRDAAPAVRKETKNIAAATGILAVATILLFLILHWLMPEKVPFDYTVILGVLGGSAVAVANFFLMGLTVQKVTSMEDRDMASRVMRASYSRRMLLQMLWVIVAIAAPCFHFVAGIVPLLFPGIYLKIRGILGKG
ncbi:MAG: ATP synthase subunit I [Blautia sp.]|nr:ATP synthase subunit I [Blautia sp.]